MELNATAELTTTTGQVVRITRTTTGYTAEVKKSARARTYTFLTAWGTGVATATAAELAGVDTAALAALVDTPAGEWTAVRTGDTITITAPDGQTTTTRGKAAARAGWVMTGMFEEGSYWYEQGERVAFYGVRTDRAAAVAAGKRFKATIVRVTGD